MPKGVVVIGDVHGCLKTLVALIAKARLEFPEAEIVISGDLQDRGPDSRGVIQYCIDNGIRVTRGNHDDMMVTDILNKPSPYKGGWLEYQARETILSYETEPGIINNDTLKTHAEWLDTLPVYIEFKDVKNGEGRYLVVSHANLLDVWRDRNTMNINDHCMWNRDLVGPEAMHLDIYNIHGHTPFPEGPRVTDTWANVDTGACFKRVHYGKLTALHFPTMKVIQQENIDE